MALEIVIAPYVAAQQAEVGAFILGVQHSFGVPTTLETQPDLAIIETFYQHEKGNFWVATVDRKVVGTIALVHIGNRQGALRKMRSEEHSLNSSHPSISRMPSSA